MYRHILYTEAEVDEMLRKMFPNAAGSYYEHAKDNDGADDEQKTDPFEAEMVRKMDRQVRYRKRRDDSLSRDELPRLPCRPYYNNGDEYEWEDQRLYSQPRVFQEEIDPKHEAANTDVCYTCTDHRLCTGPVCEARVLTCGYCESEEGPLRVRQTKERATLAKKLA